MVFKTIPRSLVVETAGRVWVLGALEDLLEENPHHNLCTAFPTFRRYKTTELTFVKSYTGTLNKSAQLAHLRGWNHKTWWENLKLAWWERPDRRLLSSSSAMTGHSQVGGGARIIQFCLHLLWRWFANHFFTNKRRPAACRLSLLEGDLDTNPDSYCFAGDQIQLLDKFPSPQPPRNKNDLLSSHSQTKRIYTRNLLWLDACEATSTWEDVIHLARHVPTASAQMLTSSASIVGESRKP